MKEPFDLPYLPVEIDYRNLIRAIGRSRSAIGELAGLLSSSRNHHLLTAPLLTNEAVLSSKIEGTIATVEEVYVYEAENIVSEESEKEKDIQEIINYRKAVEIATIELKRKPISENFIKKLHDVLMNSVRGANKQRGEFRKTQVHIGKLGAGIEGATYIPPIASNIPKLFSNWEKYLHSNDEADELVQIAISHYQFEAIHPFLDGNGRMGRLWQTLILMQKYPVFEFLPFETLISRDQDAYYKALAHSDKAGHSTVFIEYMLSIIDSSIGELLNYNHRILNVNDRLEYFLSLEKNEFTRKDYMNIFKDISSATASRDLKAGVDKNLFDKTGELNKTKYKIK